MSHIYSGKKIREIWKMKKKCPCKTLGIAEIKEKKLYDNEGP